MLSGNFVVVAQRVLLSPTPPSFEGLDELGRRAVHDGRLGAAELDEHVVELQAHKGGQGVLDGVDAGPVLLDGGAAAQVHHVVHVGVDDGLAGQIDALKLVAVAHRRGAKRHGGLDAGVQADAPHRHGGLNGVLLVVHLVGCQLFVSSVVRL